MKERKSRSAPTERLFEYRSTEKKKLILSLSITFTVMIVELVGGFLTNSIALVSDAGHMFTHSFAIGISLIAIFIARKPPCHHKTFGLYRAEILAAFINGLFLVFVVGVILRESILRIMYPREVLGVQMLVIALIGLFVNVVSIIILKGSHKKDLNIRGVFYHMVADAVSSVGIVIAALVISITGWSIIDPLVSIAISLLILRWAFGVLRDSARVLLEMTPKGLDIDTIVLDLQSTFSGIETLYNVHLWTITTDMFVFTAHLKVKESTQQNEISTTISDYLAKKYHIIESTIQIADKDEHEVCKLF